MKIRPKIILIVVFIILVLGGAAYAGVKAWIEKNKNKVFNVGIVSINDDNDDSKQPGLIPGIPPHDNPSNCKSSLISPIPEPSKIVTDPKEQARGLRFVIDQLLVSFKEGTDCEIVKESISKVKGKIISFLRIPGSGSSLGLDTYQIEMPVSSIEELYDALEVLKKDPYVSIVRRNVLMETN